MRAYIVIVQSKFSCIHFRNRVTLILNKGALTGLRVGASMEPLTWNVSVTWSTRGCDTTLCQTFAP